MACKVGTFKHVCARCKQSNNPLVPPLVKGQAELCPECMHEMELEQLRAMGSNLPGMTGVDYPSMQGKARKVIRQLMKLRVPSQREVQNGEKAGKFQPMNSDVQMIEKYAPDLCLLLREGTLRQFHAVLHPVNNRVEGRISLMGTLFDVFDSPVTNMAEYRDQNRRAETLVEEVVRRGSQRVILLDGHGRMLLSIIHAMIEKKKKTPPDLKLDPDSIEFVVVDNNRECHTFHEHFFPKKVQCRYMNVLEVALDETDMLYLNFCSIPSRLKNARINKEEVLMWIWDCMKAMQCGIMISANVRDTRARVDKEDQTIYTATGPTRGRYKDRHLIPSGFKRCLEDPGLFGVQLISMRPEQKEDVQSTCEFVTWLVTPETCKSKQDPRKLKDWFVDQGITWAYPKNICCSRYRPKHRPIVCKQPRWQFKLPLTKTRQYHKQGSKGFRHARSASHRGVQTELHVGNPPLADHHRPYHSGKRWRLSLKWRKRHVSGPKGQVSEVSNSSLHTDMGNKQNINGPSVTVDHHTYHSGKRQRLSLKGCKRDASGPEGRVSEVSSGSLHTDVGNKPNVNCPSVTVGHHTYHSGKHWRLSLKGCKRDASGPEGRVSEVSNGSLRTDTGNKPNVNSPSLTVRRRSSDEFM